MKKKKKPKKRRVGSIVEDLKRLREKEAKNEKK